MPGAMERRYLSVDEFAHWSGLSVSTIRRRLAGGTLRSVQPGGPRTRILIPCDALDETASRQPAPDAPPQAPADQQPEPVHAPRRPGPRPRWLREYVSVGDSQRD